jgi:hypothetical protein
LEVVTLKLGAGVAVLAKAVKRKAKRKMFFILNRFGINKPKVTQFTGTLPDFTACLPYSLLLQHEIRLTGSTGCFVFFL